MDLVECLSFLFQISFATLGKVSTTYIYFVVSVMSVLSKACCMRNSSHLKMMMKRVSSEKGGRK